MEIANQLFSHICILDELEKTFKREKEAEVTSDLVDTDIESTLTRQPRKNYRRVIESSESEEERYNRPPKIKIKKLSGMYLL